MTYKAPEKKKEAMGIPNSSNHNPRHIFGLVFHVVGNVSCLRSAIERKRKMDTTRLIRELRGEKGRIERAIAALIASLELLRWSQLLNQFTD